MKKKLLVAVDGSVYSSNTTYYLASLFRKHRDIDIHLLTASPSGPLPEGHLILTDEDLQNTISAEARTRHEGSGRFIDKAREQLIRYGIGPERITSGIRLSRLGIAADIVDEARQGMYDAVVIGRRGLGKLEQVFMGSISTTVLERCRDIPVWIIDGKVDSRKFLVPVDGTPHTLRAIDHLCFTLQGIPDTEITLFHSKAIFRQRPAIEPHHFYDYWEPEWCRKHLDRIDSHFHGPEQLLLENGFSPKNIHRLETQMGMYPSRQIVRQAMLDDFGTIVMGRRSEDAKKGVLGSVSGHVIAMAVNTAVWIVG